jgi:hypothetical protein
MRNLIGLLEDNMEQGEFKSDEERLAAESFNQEVEEESGNSVGNENLSDLERLHEDKLNAFHQIRSLLYQKHCRDNGAPRWENPDNKKYSDILIDFDTMTDGVIKARIGNNGKIVFDIPSLSDRQNLISHRLIDLMHNVSSKIEGIEFSVNGQPISLPERSTNQKGEEESSNPINPPTVPLDQQNLDYDPHSGGWYGSPPK